MTSTGHFPTAVSPVTITAAAPSATALKISLTSARVGTGFCSMDASICVTTSQQVQAGQVLGYVGHTGRATGSHLHLEVHVNGSRADAMSYFGT